MKTRDYILRAIRRAIIRYDHFPATAPLLMTQCLELRFDGFHCIATRYDDAELQ